MSQWGVPENSSAHGSMSSAVAAALTLEVVRGCKREVHRAVSRNLRAGSKLRRFHGPVLATSVGYAAFVAISTVLGAP